MCAVQAGRPPPSFRRSGPSFRAYAFPMGFRSILRSWTVLVPLTVLATATACSGESSTSGPAPAAAGSENGGDPIPPSATGRPKLPTTVPGDAEAAASCTGAPGELYALTATMLGGETTVPLCTLKGNVALIVNGASNCGYTPQYKPLQALYAKYKDGTNPAPFEVLAFPSDSFNQEEDSDQAVSDFCTTEYGITFPLFTIAPVIDDTAKKVTAQPVFQWLYAQPGMSAKVAWNFEKFLVSKEGKVVKRFEPDSTPEAIEPEPTLGGEIDLAIAAELAR